MAAGTSWCARVDGWPLGLLGPAVHGGELTPLFPLRDVLGDVGFP